MLKLTVLINESFDEANDEFISETATIDLEHSLVSLSKWESHWEKPFLTTEKTTEQTLWYVQAMVISENPPENFLKHLDSSHIQTINDYINAKMTATWFTERGPHKPNREIFTAEVIYYWMVSMNIPFECQYWHLNKLMTLIRVISEKNAPPKKMSQAELLQRNRELNARRRAELGTKG